MNFLILLFACTIPQLVLASEFDPDAIGPPGPQEPPGAEGDQRVAAIEPNWKQCAWQNLNDNRDYGLVEDCAFIKLNNETALKVEFNGDYRIAFCLRCCRRWYFTFNGAECNNPLPIDAVHHIQSNHERTNYNIHRTTQIGGYCMGIAAGFVRVGINVGDCAGYGIADAYTGWNSVTRIMIEEVPPSQ